VVQAFKGDRVAGQGRCTVRHKRLESESTASHTNLIDTGMSLTIIGQKLLAQDPRACRIRLLSG
jgi:hypothetical protein